MIGVSGESQPQRESLARQPRMQHWEGRKKTFIFSSLMRSKKGSD